MEIRVLRYFLAAAREENITKAAESLHITQPTLSRQLAELEEETGVILFERGSRKIRLTEEGIFLRRRAEEIVSLADQTLEDLNVREEELSGTVAIGTGGFGANRILFAAIKAFREKHPHVQFAVSTGTADVVQERLDHGTIDIAVLMEPVSKDSYEYIRFSGAEEFRVLLRADDELAQKEFIVPDDLAERTLILPGRNNVRAEVLNWLRVSEKQLDVEMTSDLGPVTADAVYETGAAALLLCGALPFADSDSLVLKPMSPKLTASLVLLYKKDIPMTKTVREFITSLKCLSGME